MTLPGAKQGNGHLPVVCCLLLVLLLLLTWAAAAVAQPDSPAAAATVDEAPDPLLAGLGEDEILRLGERMYRDGILPSGEVMQAFIRGDVEVDGMAFSCSSCHQRAGLGSVEGGVVTPPTTGRKLYQPYHRPPSLNDVVHEEGRYVYAKTILDRPPYTRQQIKDAIRYGYDSAGEPFNDIMPRYPLADRDMAILVRYLELLSADYSPGAEIGSFRFATIITDDVSAEDRKALLDPLNRFVDGQNNQLHMFREYLKYGYRPTGDMKYAFRKVSLAVWELKGDPASWREQLAAYQRRDQVFAVLGGISNREWRPIHEFCEAERLPCIYPVTDLPVVSKDSWYTLYFNKGYYQQGEAAGRYLRRAPELQGGGRILQLVQDSPQGRALAEGFAAGLRKRPQVSLETRTLDRSQLRDGEQLAKWVAGQRPGVLLVWADADILPALPGMAAGLGSPQLIFVSSIYLGGATIDIPDALRDRVLITYPYRLKPFVGDEEGASFLARVPLETTYRSLSDRRIASRTATMLSQAVTQGLLNIEDNLYRDYLLDELSMQMDRVTFDFERFSFGPGQRYSSKGCYILQLGPGTEPELIPRSEWVVH